MTKTRELYYHIVGKISRTKNKKDTPVHQHTRVVRGLAPFLLTDFLHIQEVPLCCFNIANLTVDNATTERKKLNNCICDVWLIQPLFSPDLCLYF